MGPRPDQTVSGQPASGRAQAPRLTMLNGMADGDIARAIERLAGWGVRDLDLKDAIFGRRVADLDDAQANRVAALAAARGMAIHCLSTHLFNDAIEAGEAHFRAHHLAPLRRVVAVARILRPRLVRLLSARSSAPHRAGNAVEALDATQPWLMPLYGEAVDELAAAGLQVTIENEIDGCLMSGPDEVVAFFDRLGRRDRCSYTWDVQNLWQQGGEPPSLATYRRLQPLIGYLHLKGGQRDEASPRLRWCTALADASWPVAEVVRAAASDGVSPVICLNPSHGERKPGYDDTDLARRDLEFVRRVLEDEQ